MQWFSTVFRKHPEADFVVYFRTIIVLHYSSAIPTRWFLVLFEYNFDPKLG